MIDMNPLQIPDQHYRIMLYLIKNHTPDDEISIADVRKVGDVTGMTLNAMGRNGMLRKIRNARKDGRIYYPAVYRIDRASYDRALRLCNIDNFVKGKIEYNK
jgi:hypothetical protein